MSRTTGSTREMTAAALLAALLAAVSFVAIPTGIVPITLQTFVVVLIALLLRPLWALASVGVYLLIGAIGMPVFAGVTGGIGHLLGPTGGFLFGFLLGAVIGSYVRVQLQGRGVPQLAADVACALVTVGVFYLLGITQLFALSHLGATPGGGMSLGAATIAGTAGGVFLVVDVIKAAVAIAVAEVLRRTGVVPDASRAEV